ncbi:MAG: hypothetical protein ACMUIE_03895 [Thermoplasmatota archaeon]
MAAPGKFTPVQRSFPPQGPPPARGGFPIAPVVMVVAYLIYLGAAIVGPLFVEPLGEFADGLLEPLYRLIIAGILFVIFAVAIVYMAMAPSAPPGSPPGGAPPGRPGFPPPAPPGQQGKFRPVAPPSFSPPVAAKQPSAPPKKEEPPIKKVEAERKGPTLVVYPLEVEGGIFGETYIALSEAKVLKLRSMLIGPEHLG